MNIEMRHIILYYRLLSCASRYVNVFERENIVVIVGMVWCSAIVVAHYLTRLTAHIF